MWGVGKRDEMVRPFRKKDRRGRLQRALPTLLTTHQHAPVPLDLPARGLRRLPDVPALRPKMKRAFHGKKKQKEIKCQRKD